MAVFSDWQRILNEYYRNETFEAVVQRLVAKAREQLHDSYAIQKMYDGTSGSSVWENRVIRHYKNPMNTTLGFVTIHNWHEESLWRKKNDHQVSANGKILERWYGTGESRKKTDISILNDDLMNGVIEFNTTFGLLMAEMGLGLNGKKAVRGKGKKGRRGIKVQRDAPYVAKKRYTEWVPGEGKSHRPTTKRQANFLARAIRNYAADCFGYNMCSWLIFSLAKGFDTQRAIVPYSDYSHELFDAYIETEQGRVNIKQVPKPKKL